MIPPLIVALLAQSAFAKGPLDIEVPDAIADLHNRHGACMDANFDVARVRDRGAMAAGVGSGSR